MIQPSLVVTVGIIDQLAQRYRPRPKSASDVLALCYALMSERAEISGSRLAAETLAAYGALPDNRVEECFDLLASKFTPDPERVWTAAGRYRDDPTSATLLALQNAAEPPRQELFRRLNMAPGGTRVLVDLRRRLLATLDAHPNRAGIDSDLLHLFRSWFNRGFLLLQRIDWHTPAVVLERLIRYEAVHEIQGWRDLRRRLEADRRCYGFFHPALPNDPLIFIEVALTHGLPPSVQPLVDPDSPVDAAEQANHAVFYSITNCQEGLRGVSFGSFLIKQVAEDLSREFPKLRTFSTLSPIPGFRSWLESRKEDEEVPSPELRLFLATRATAAAAVMPAMEEELSSLCAHYLLDAKRSDHAPVDAVARFHLANGARLERINWMGDTSKAGIRRSFGLTANYTYQLKELEDNHEAYARDLRVVATPTLKRMAARAQRTKRAAAR